jgi:NSS family neurotransmitter:Na+ symporter
MVLVSTPDDPRPGWRSRSGFLLATIGSAVGIGSIWKFPYEVGSNGGGAFVLIYLAGLVAVVVPLMLAEFAVGRRGRADATTSLRSVAVEEGTRGPWSAVGFVGAATAFLVLSFYAVIGGWTIRYAVSVILRGLPTTALAVDEEFRSVLAAPGQMMAFQAVFLVGVALVVLRGVQQGIERSMKILMPLLAVLLVALAIYSLRTGDAARGVRFLLVPDFAHMSGRTVLDALGLGFFSIGVGLGILLTYAAYSPPRVDLRMVAFASVAADTAISLLAGLAIFPVVFANDLDPASGPGLAFVSLPLAFSAMPAGRAAATAFFILLAVAALASAISMLETVVAVLDRRLGWSRRRGVTVGTVACFIAGIATVLSFNDWSGVHPLRRIPRYAEATIYALLDDATSQVLLPLGGLAFAVFVGWVLPRTFLATELGLRGVALTGLRFVLRVVAPVVVLGAAAASIVA